MIKQKTLWQSKVKDGSPAQWDGDIGASDPVTLVVRWLKGEFGQDVVWLDRAHIPDSYVTNTDYFFVVREVDDDTLERSCHSVFNNILVDVIVYERKDCRTAGFLELVDKFLTIKVKELRGNYGLIEIQDAGRETARNLQFIEDNFRARAISLSIDYGYCI